MGLVIGLIFHLAINLLPLLSSSREILQLACMHCLYSTRTLLRYLGGGFLIGFLIGWIVQKVKGNYPAETLINLK